MYVTLSSSDHLGTVNTLCGLGSIKTLKTKHMWKDILSCIYAPMVSSFPQILSIMSI